MCECWEVIPVHFPLVSLDAFAVMPDHVHGICWIRSEATHPSPLRPKLADKFVRKLTHYQSGPPPGSIGAIIGSFKSAVTRRINREIFNVHLADLESAPINPRIGVWQRNYYERLIRDWSALNQIRRYIANNPKRAGSSV